MWSGRVFKCVSGTNAGDVTSIISEPKAIKRHRYVFGNSVRNGLQEYKCSDLLSGIEWKEVLK